MGWAAYDIDKKRWWSYNDIGNTTVYESQFSAVMALRQDDDTIKKYIPEFGGFTTNARIVMSAIVEDQDLDHLTKRYGLRGREGALGILRYELSQLAGQRATDWHQDFVKTEVVA